MAGPLLNVVWLGLEILKLWALVDCATRPVAAFPLHDKLTKTAWLVILVISALLGLVAGPIGVLSIAGTIAAVVYLVDVRPAVSGRAL
jgi:hypothetical protein